MDAAAAPLRLDRGPLPQAPAPGQPVAAADAARPPPSLRPTRASCHRKARPRRALKGAAAARPGPGDHARVHRRGRVGQKGHNGHRWWLRGERPRALCEGRRSASPRSAGAAGGRCPRIRPSSRRHGPDSIKDVSKRGAIVFGRQASLETCGFSPRTIATFVSVTRPTRELDRVVRCLESPQVGARSAWHNRQPRSASKTACSPFAKD